MPQGIGRLAVVCALAAACAGVLACSSDDKSGASAPQAGATNGGQSAGGSGGTSNAGNAGTSSGGAAPSGPCSALPGTLVYVESGDTQENLLKNLGRHLRDTADITIAFNLTGSCTLTSDIYTAAKMVPNGTLKYIPSTAENPAWTPSQTEATCTTSADGAPIDLAISALFVQSCALGEPPLGSHLSLIQGPIQAYTFVVPTASDQTAIWAEEAYYAFGFGNANPLAPTYNPWNNENFLFIRPATKSTLVATAKNIAVPPNKWKGVAESASGDVVSAVTNSSMPEPTLGILGAEVYDANRGKGIKTLAFQAFGQSGAFYPDSTSSAFDKQNLRDGHYTLWSPTVYITETDADGVATNPAVKTITDLVGIGAGTTPASTPFDGLADVVKVGLIPDCAMQVTRSEDGGDLQSYQPTAPCTCYYLSKINGGSATPAGCTACTNAGDCSGGANCNYGFCEPDAAAPAAGSEPPGCFGGSATTHTQLINACTSAQSIAKDVVLPGTNGELEPLP